MAKDGLWRLGLLASVLIVAAVSIAFYLNRPAATPWLAIQKLRIPDGITNICGVDKDGFLIHVKVAVYDSEGKFVARGESVHPYACAAIPGIKAGDYWVALLRK